jgi:hypothetical protein
MPSYQFSSISVLSDATILNNGLFLCVLHADKIPPHIGISINGLYYSLKAKGKDVSLPVNEVLKIVERKKIATLFIGLTSEVSKLEIEKVFSGFDKAIAYQSSCLSPLKQIFKMDEGVQKLSGFLLEIEERQLINKVYELCIPSGYTQIPDYDVKEIHDRLEKLNAKTKVNHV